MILEETKILKVSPDLSDKDDMQKLEFAGEILRKGGLVAFPTETVYGLGANALDKDAVENIFRAKGRPQDNPLITDYIGYVDFAFGFGDARPIIFSNPA